MDAPDSQPGIRAVVRPTRSRTEPATITYARSLWGSPRPGGVCRRLLVPASTLGPARASRGRVPTRGVTFRNTDAIRNRVLGYDPPTARTSRISAAVFADGHPSAAIRSGTAGILLFFDFFFRALPRAAAGAAFAPGRRG